jgi:hypothetical protein
VVSHARAQKSEAVADPTQRGDADERYRLAVLSGSDVKIDGKWQPCRCRRRVDTGRTPSDVQPVNDRASRGDQRSNRDERSVIVAVAAVGMVQMPLHEIVDVIPVRNGWVSAVRTVLVGRCVPVARVIGRAPVGIRATDGDGALVDVVAVYFVEVAVVEIVDVSIVFHREMSAMRAVDVVVLGMGRMRGHRVALSGSPRERVCELIYRARTAAATPKTNLQRSGGMSDDARPFFERAA